MNAFNNCVIGVQVMKCLFKASSHQKSGGGQGTTSVEPISRITLRVGGSGQENVELLWGTNSVFFIASL